jgi:foldase protein PrsA
VKIAKDGFRRERTLWLVVFVAALAAGDRVLAQQDVTNSAQGRSASRTSARKKVNLGDIQVPPVRPAAIPVNPTDPIAIVNGQIISRAQLADECVARKGKEILDMLINRTIIEQALRARKLEVTAADIDREIEAVAHRFQITREKWLRSLDKERGISPIQYARDVIYPALALRKLCAGRVQVTPKDMQDAFEAQFGEKLRLRMIMVDKESTAVEIWEELHKNPGAFEKLAQERSMDSGSRSLGGLLAEPMTRHAYPQTISDSAFRQLVDGDPRDKNPSHKPKDGDFTGPIQVAETAWVILRRESVLPVTKGVDLKDERIRKQVYEMIYDVKLKETMGLVFQEMLKASGIENKLTGTIKLAKEEQEPDFVKSKAEFDGHVDLMSNPGGRDENAAGSSSKPAADPSAVPRQKIPPPAALSPDAVQQFNSIQRPLKPGGNATPSANSPN